MHLYVLGAVLTVLLCFGNKRLRGPSANNRGGFGGLGLCIWGLVGALFLGFKISSFSNRSRCKLQGLCGTRPNSFPVISEAPGLFLYCSSFKPMICRIVLRSTFVFSLMKTWLSQTSNTLCKSSEEIELPTKRNNQTVHCINQLQSCSPTNDHIIDHFACVHMTFFVGQNDM